MTLSDETERARQDEAARAAWLYYRGGLRQEQIAAEMGISRQRVQRLVARATAEGLVRVRIEHPIAACEELQAELCRRFGLQMARVAPALPGPGEAGGRGVAAVAPLAAQWLERQLSTTEPQVIGLGSGRALRAAADQVLTLEASQHRLASFVGNVAPDGAAVFHEALMQLAERSGAAPHLMPVPVMAETEADVATFHALSHVRQARALAHSATVALVGVGRIAVPAPLSPSLSDAVLASLCDAGAVGELCGHAFDAEGRFVDHPVNRRMLGVRLPLGGALTVGLAAGPDKVAALRGALRGQLLRGLITDQPTAEALLQG